MDRIILDNITKEYGARQILTQINATFSAGASIAFVGHNGCGKSTLLKIIAGLVTPTNGAVRYTTPFMFGYVPERFMPQPLSARTYLRRMGEMDGLKSQELETRIETLAKDFFLFEMLDTSMKALSKGTLQKIGVIQAIMKKPQVLLLDEPLSGQDIESQKVFIAKVNELRNEGVTIFMSCHEQSLMDAISEKAYTIRDGKLIPFAGQTLHTVTLLLENTASKPLHEGMKRYGTGYLWKVEKEEANALILKLLQDGWELKGMYQDEDDKYGEISTADIL